MKSKIIAGLLIMVLPVVAETYETKWIDSSLEKNAVAKHRCESADLFVWKHGIKEKLAELSTTVYSGEETLKIVQVIKTANESDVIIDTAEINSCALDRLNTLPAHFTNGHDIDPAIQSYLHMNLNSAVLVYLPLEAYFQAGKSQPLEGLPDDMQLSNSASVTKVKKGIYTNNSGKKIACFIVTIHDQANTMIYWIEESSRQFMKMEAVHEGTRITIQSTRSSEASA